MPSADPNSGPVQVSLDYHVDPTRVQEFLGVMQEVGRQRRRNGAVAWRLEPVEATGSQNVAYREVIRYRTLAEQRRQPARMSQLDLSQLEKARQFHNADSDLPGRTEILTRDSGTTHAPFKTWAGDQFSLWFDRVFDETAATFDRFAALRDRERKLQKPEYRDFHIRLP